MAAARRIQLGMLPDVATRFGPEARLDVAARMQSARDVGGDLYDCFMLDEHRAFVLLGDVCGKGVPASLFMATCRTLCKSVALRGSIDLAQLMNQANLEIARENPEMLFVTAFAAILDLRDGQLCYANAGHERPFVVAPGRQPQRLDGAAGLPLGLVESGQYPVSRYRLAPDEFLCIFTDGVSEASDAAQAVFGIERLAQVLRAAAPAGRAQDVLDALFNAVAAFAAGAEPSDDVTVLVLRVGA
jgi:serine phosphatase RsbU (regulator of sigma subunit)